MNPKEAYSEMLERSKEIALLGSIAGVLHWDERTQIPDAGHQHRIEQLSFLTRLRHQRATDPRWAELLSVAEGNIPTDDPFSFEAANLREWRHMYDRATKIPEKLAVELTKAAAEGQAVWEKTRPANDWDGFKPYLERIVSLSLEKAEALGYDDEPYDALLDDYERGEKARGIGPVLKGLRQPLTELLERIAAASCRPDSTLRQAHFPREEQVAFSKAVVTKLGYDFSGGRLDVSAHPFTIGIGPGDVRITTRYDEHHFNEAFFATVHEAGHAMYHQGLPLRLWGSPVCSPISLGINESQSRMWENMVARSLGFWRHFYPEAQAIFPALKGVALEAFLLSINDVHPSLIRVGADEVTYNLHIILRFELETALMRQEIIVADLPDAWNQKMKEYLGLTPPNFADGVMQDVHWSGGAIGYFPTYTLGNLYAAQLFAAAEEDVGDLEDMFSRGEFTPLLEWLRSNIHSQGSRRLPRDLLKNVVGADLNTKYLIDYLEAKYRALYGF